MSGEAIHDDTRGCPEQGAEASPAASDRSEYVPSAWITVGCPLLGFGLLLVGCGLFLLTRDSGCSRVDFTRAKIATIEKYVQDHKNRHGDYPPSLAVLTVSEDGKAAPDLEQSDLLDDWGAPIRYDPHVLGPSGRPKIFAVTPEGDEIANW
jgi:hypothetical protein